MFIEHQLENTVCRDFGGLLLIDSCEDPISYRYYSQLLYRYKQTAKTHLSHREICILNITK